MGLPKIDWCKRCKRLPTATPRATLCAICFHAVCQSAGSKSGGNHQIGKTKKNAGRQSGIKRSSNAALVIRKKWLDLILAKKKTWELRSQPTSRRGWIHLAEASRGGILPGRARIIDCFRLRKNVFTKNFTKHRVQSATILQYKKIFAWVLADVQRFGKPFKYKHPRGAVTWVTIRCC